MMIAKMSAMYARMFRIAFLFCAGFCMLVIPVCLQGRFACDGIDGSKISTVAPNSGFAPFAASADRAAASSPAVKPNPARSRSPCLPDISPH